jgi:pimeloyl-ACP methyl ester carboxylesterase
MRPLAGASSGYDSPVPNQPTPKRLGAYIAVAALLNLVRRARRTRPEPLPPAPDGSTTVITYDGTRLHAQVGGPPDGETTLVFVHGLLARSIEFDMQWVAFADKARLVRYDHRNHGRSERNRSRITIETLADDLAAVITKLAPSGKVVLVGHSLGGMTTLAFARRHERLFRERIAGVCLVATRAGHYVEDHPVENGVRWMARHHVLDLPLQVVRVAAPVIERFRPRRTRLARALVRRFLFGAGDADPATISMVQELLEEPPLSVLSTLDRSVLRHDGRDALKVLGNVPVHIVGGDEDALSWVEHATQIGAALGPLTKVTTLRGVGHALLQTRPVEVNRVIYELTEAAEGKWHRRRPVVPTVCSSTTSLISESRHR